ncbi:hypothetical protein M422DRAFT_272056 [Sphaerobolus stellatus SS14]|uniref:Uncharacterized protein n=1 Tax=Sphaerobolus stellatus (strain SS14) TaxID=990650 RepID=A0A0C9TCE3_SPHS4|nr:hypothetical protein M422DRAFT_272056 [Sphaerobolus stellatus SS14]
MAAQLSPLSASVTRILALSGFPSELKTRDIQAAFGEWETVNGGFKIKWRDDTSLLIVFADPAIAKRAYLQAIAQPPAVLSSPTTSKTAVIRPYDGPDAQSVIAAVNARTHSHTASRGHHARASLSSPISAANGTSNPRGKGHHTTVSTSTLASATSSHSPLNGLVSIPESFPRDHSPTLPNVPAHPTLTSLINLSLSPNGPAGEENTAELFVPTSAGNAAVPIVQPRSGSGSSTPSDGQQQQSQTQVHPPRIGDPARRMMGHALGIRHPGLGGGDALGKVQRSMSGLTITTEE